MVDGCLDRQRLLNSSGYRADGEPQPAFSPCNSSKDHPGARTLMRLIKLIDLRSLPVTETARYLDFSRHASFSPYSFYAQYINRANISMYRKGTSSNEIYCC